ncbi:MAG: sugar ABC transporter permease [Clostridia bacterium]|nr:sugar ABC transporter permease [Clostridia bacterium]
MSTFMQKQTWKQKTAYTAKRIWRFRASYAFVAPFLLIFLTFTFLPVAIAIFYSFTQFNVLEPAKWIGLENFKNLFLNDAVFMTAVKNTMVLSVVIAGVSFLLCILLGWFINDFSPRVRTILTFLFYAPSLANVYYVWQLIFSGDSNGFINAYLMKLGVITEAIQWFTDTRYMTGVVIFVLLWSSLGTGFLVMIAGFQNVDTALYEAGAIDGIKNRWQEMWFITLPYLRPQLMFSAVTTITGSFSIGGAIDILCGNPSTDYQAWTIMNHLNDYGGTRFEMGYACAIAVLLFLLMVGVNSIVQKMLTKIGD